MMRGWRLAGIRRSPGPLVGTVAASAVAATLAVAATTIAGAHTTAPAGRLASASVVVAANTKLHVTVGSDGAESIPLSAYGGVPASVARELARVPGVASATGESGFPGGVVRAGDVDLVAVTARAGTSPGQLAQRIRAVLPSGYTVATGAARGDLANLSVPAERANGQALGGALIPPIAGVSMFVLASTTALAVNLRRRRFALLRTIGASRGQVRRAILAELTVCGLAGGLLGVLPGAALGALGVHALAAHQMLPAGSAAWLTPWLLLIGCGSSALVAGLSGQVAGRRGSRTPPAQALRQTTTEHRWPHPVRVLLGLAAAGGTGTLAVYTLSAKSPAGQLALAFPLLLACMLTVALLGPLLVALAAGLARPLQAAGGPSARLALAAITAQPRRTASAVIPVAMAVALVGCVYFANTSIAHATTGQAAQTVTAGHVLSGPQLGQATLNRLTSRPGVHAAAGLAPVAVIATDPDLDQLNGEAVAGGPLSQVMDLGVTSGRLTALRPGQIAVSALEAGSGELNVHTGSALTVWLPDGTPYRATVSAVYSRSLAAGDILIPAAVAAGHTGAAPGFTQLLISGGTPASLAGLTAGHPGWHLATRQVASAQAGRAAAQDSFGDDLILGVIAALTAVSLVNTLAVATLERRRAMRLLGRAGATRGQVMAVSGWHAVFVILTGVAAGVAAGAVALLTVTRAATGSWTPYIPFAPATGLVLAVAALTVAAVMIPARVMLRREPALS
jgi:putative ABC transport system permease protein